jgi:hypothetical protein
VDAPFLGLRGSELAILFVACGGVALVWTQLFPNLTTSVAPRGIISLQLARSSERAAAIVQSFQEAHREGTARRSLYVDFPFILLYSFALAFLGLLAGRAALASGLASSATADSLALATATAAWAAGLCDCLENVGLLFMLRGKTGQPLPGLTTAAAWAKFGLLTSTGLFVVGVLLASSIAAIF